MKKLNLSSIYSPLSAINPDKCADSTDSQSESNSATMDGQLTRVRLINARQLGGCIRVTSRWATLSYSSGRLFNLSQATRQRLRGYCGWPDLQDVFHLRRFSLRLVRRSLLIRNAASVHRRIVLSGSPAGPKVPPYARWVLTF